MPYKRLEDKRKRDKFRNKARREELKKLGISVLYDRTRYLKNLYNITTEQYNTLLCEQNFKCAICGIPQENYNKPLFIDHDHLTGKIRGLLCSSCNFILGFTKDDINILRNAIEYLLRFMGPELSPRSPLQRDSTPQGDDTMGPSSSDSEPPLKGPYGTDDKSDERTGSN